MKKPVISHEIREQMDSRIEAFNKKLRLQSKCYYISRYKGKFMYLDRFEYGMQKPVCRLKFNGKVDSWEFAIFKWSDEAYDSEEMFFPGEECVDGTVEGAMKAGVLAYPVG